MAPLGARNTGGLPSSREPPPPGRPSLSIGLESILALAASTSALLNHLRGGGGGEGCRLCIAEGGRGKGEVDVPCIL